ncbi:MAG: hypothetical protein R3192_09635 [Woeseiaceae bacterium]|nr:hypothetical protein [Woeseiaceae bacterium]
MSLQEIANFAEILGAAGVIGSLLYVGWQVNANTKTNRMRMHEQVTQTYLSFLKAVLADPEAFMLGLQSTDERFKDLTNAQKTFFFGTMLGLFKHYELMFVQHDQGVMDRETWEAWSEHIRMYFHQPGTQSWWALRKATFIPGFRDYLASTSPPAMTSFVDLLND